MHAAHVIGPGHHMYISPEDTRRDYTNMLPTCIVTLLAASWAIAQDSQTTTVLMNDTRLYYGFGQGGPKTK